MYVDKQDEMYVSPGRHIWYELPYVKSSLNRTHNISLQKGMGVAIHVRYHSFVKDKDYAY